MTTARRLSFSLLISTLAFAAFAVVAFSGLFPWIEAQFYSPKVVTELQGRLARAETGLEAWKDLSLERLDKMLADGSFDGVFSPTASQDVLQKRVQASRLFLLGLRGGGSLRILSGDLTQIHFSTEDTDVKVKGDFSITYRPVAEAAGLPDLKSGSGLADKARVLVDPLGTSVYILQPWKDSQGLLPGFVLLAISLEDLRMSLLEAGIPLGNQPVVPLGAEDYLLSLLGQKTDAVVLSRIRDLQNQGILPPVQRLARADGQLTVALVHKGHLSLLVPSSSLELDSTLKILLLLSFYTVIFLVTYLLANLRGEPLSVVTRKVKRFQLQVVKQYLDLKEQDKIQSLRDELASHSDEIRSDVRRSLGRVRKRDQEWVDRYIDTSWQEVMDLLRGPSPPVESASQADWKRLETLLQQALTQGRFVVSSPAATGPARTASTEDVAELEVADDAQEAEAVEELEEVDEAEAVEELEEADEAEAVEELEEAEEAEPVEELEEAEEAEPVEELEEAEEAEPVEELEEAEEAEPVEDVEELGDAEPAEERHIAPADLLSFTGSEDSEELEELEEGEPDGSGTDELGSLEELQHETGDSTLYRLRPARPGEDEVTNLPSSPDADAGEAVEMLDELEEAVEEIGDELLEEVTDEDASFSLESLDAAWDSDTAGIFAEDDEVVTLRDELFAFAGSRDDEFGHLVGEVLAGPDGEAFEPLEEDLVPRHQSREWRWTGGGFDWDRFALGPDEVNLFRALSEIVTEFDAFTAAILTGKEGGWAAQSSVGFSDSGKALLEFGPDAPLTKSFLSIRALHVLKGGVSHQVLRSSFHAKDLKFLKSIVCVPLLFRHEPAWLLLGLRHEPRDLLVLLAPRQVD